MSLISKYLTRMFVVDIKSDPSVIRPVFDLLIQKKCYNKEIDINFLFNQSISEGDLFMINVGEDGLKVIVEYLKENYEKAKEMSEYCSEEEDKKYFLEVMLCICVKFSRWGVNSLKSLVEESDKEGLFKDYIEYESLRFEEKIKYVDSVVKHRDKIFYIPPEVRSPVLKYALSQFSFII